MSALFLLMAIFNYFQLLFTETITVIISFNKEESFIFPSIQSTQMRETAKKYLQNIHMKRAWGGNSYWYFYHTLTTKDS